MHIIGYTFCYWGWPTFALTKFFIAYLQLCELWDMMCYSAEAANRRWLHSGHKVMDLVNNITQEGSAT